MQAGLDFLHGPFFGGNKGDHDPKDRRRHPNFLLPAEPPVWGKAHARMSFRERIKAWNDSIVGDLNAFPYIVFVYYTFKVFVYCYLFEYKIRNQDVGLFDEDNIKRALLYNIVQDVLGLNSTGGPLGFRMKAFFVTWYNLLVPGSITCPLVPGVPAKRKLWQSVGYVLFIASLVRALRAPGLLTLTDIGPVVGILAVLTPFDLITFEATRGEHSGYMLLCCLFPWTHALHGLRCCQACLWFFAGTAKIGPWMKFVMAFMMPNSKLLAAMDQLAPGAISDLLYKDRHGKDDKSGGRPDVNPSRLLELLAHAGVAAEVSLGPLCFFLPQLGVPLSFVFHGFILSMTPFASVMEWNVFCIYLSFALFGGAGASTGFTGYSIASLADALASLPLLLGCFLAFVLLFVPVYGQLYPKRVPFLVAFRPYAGNWRFSWHIVSNAAKDKVRKLKTLEGPFIAENAELLWAGNPHFCTQFEDYLSGNMVFFPHFRPLIPMVEKLEKRMKWQPGEYTTLFQEVFLNAICGWTLGTGYYVNEAYMKAVTETCGFVKGEMFVAVFEPMGLLDHTSEWHLVDITEPGVKIFHGKMPYAELEDMQPCDMTVQMFDKASVLDKKEE